MTPKVMHEIPSRRPWRGPHVTKSVDAHGMLRSIRWVLFSSPWLELAVEQRVASEEYPHMHADGCNSVQVLLFGLEVEEVPAHAVTNTTLPANVTSLAEHRYNKLTKLEGGPLPARALVECRAPLFFVRRHDELYRVNLPYNTEKDGHEPALILQILGPMRSMPRYLTSAGYIHREVYISEQRDAARRRIGS